MYIDFRARAMQIAQAMAIKEGLPKEKVHPGELLLFARINPDVNSYEFSLNHDEAIKVFPDAKGLRDRDGFIAVGMALGLATVKVASDVEYPGTIQIVYHPDANLFNAPATSSTALTEVEALRSFYSGDHTLQTNEGIRIDRAKNLFFLTVQETQHSATTVNITNGHEIKEIGAAVRFGGGDENKVTIFHNCKDKTDISGPADRNNYLCLRLVGSRLKGLSTKKYLN